jgi:hypothetical protein
LNSIIQNCLTGIDEAVSEDERGLLRNTLNSIIGFESNFGDLENQFWGFIDAARTRDDNAIEYFRDLAFQKGYDGFVEYPLAELEKCHSWIDDITTEVGASGWVERSFGISD